MLERWPQKKISLTRALCGIEGVPRHVGIGFQPDIGETCPARPKDRSKTSHRWTDNVCAYVYIYICIDTYGMYMYIYVYVAYNMCMCVYIHTYVCMYVCLHMHARMHACMHACMKTVAWVSKKTRLKSYHVTACVHVHTRAVSRHAHASLLHDRTPVHTCTGVLHVCAKVNYLSVHVMHVLIDV